MTDQLPRPQGQTQEGQHRDDTAHWARYVETLKVPEGLLSPNVEGHRPVGPLQGFGKMWQKTFKVRLEGASASPAEVVETWRERSPRSPGLGRASGCLWAAWCPARSHCWAAASRV